MYFFHIFIPGALLLFAGYIIGVFLFVVSFGVICAWFVRDSIQMKEEKGRLEFVDL